MIREETLPYMNKQLEGFAKEHIIPRIKRNPPFAWKNTTLLCFDGLEQFRQTQLNSLGR